MNYPTKLIFKESVLYKLNSLEANIISFDLDNYFTITGSLKDIIPSFEKGTSLSELVKIIQTEKNIPQDKAQEAVTSLIHFLSSFGLLQGSVHDHSSVSSLETTLGIMKSKAIEINNEPIYAAEKESFENSNSH